MTGTAWEHRREAPGQPVPDTASGWLAVTATERGAAHRAAGMPNQDAVATIPLANGGMIAAVADGHGHSRHFRSARGAQLAVSIACQAARDLATRPGGTAGTAHGGAVAGHGDGER